MINWTITNPDLRASLVPGPYAKKKNQIDEPRLVTKSVGALFDHNCSKRAESDAAVDPSQLKLSVSLFSESA